MKKILALCLLGVAFNATADLFDDCRTRRTSIMFNESKDVEERRVQYCPRSAMLSEFTGMACKRIDGERLACLPLDDFDVMKKVKRSDTTGICIAAPQPFPAKYMCAEELR